MKAIVIGGAGFLGSHLCDKLLELEHSVTCVDNLLTGSRVNIEHLNSNNNFQFIETDVTKTLPSDLEGDLIFHLASPASPNHHSQKSYHALWEETMKVNTIGTWNLCELAVKNNAKFLFASTSEAYGDPLEHPQKEEYRGNVSTTGPRSVYDEAKRFGETITAAFTRSKGLDGRIIRIFNTYGPRMASGDGRAVIEFLEQARANQPITVFGDGKQTRSFCYVSDLVDGIIKVMLGENTKGEIYNLGNPGEFSILELAQIIKDITHSNSEIIHSEDLPTDDPQKRRPDITKVKTQLGWQPQIDLTTGLKKLISSLDAQPLKSS